MLFKKKKASLNEFEERIKKIESNFNKRVQHMNESLVTMKDTAVKLKDENTELKKDRQFLMEKNKESIRKIPRKSLKHQLREMIEKERDLAAPQKPKTTFTKEKVNKNTELDATRSKTKHVFLHKPKSETFTKPKKNKFFGFLKKTPKKEFKARTKTETKVDASDETQTNLKKTVKLKKTTIIDPDHQQIKTPIDLLFELVMDEGIVKIPDAARHFNVHETQIEEWGKVLEGYGLIEIHYPPVGKAELRKKI